MDLKFSDGVSELAYAFDFVAFGFEFVGNLIFGKVVGEAFDNDFQYSFLGKRESMEVSVAFG